jgi:hypothetical protein
MLLPFLLLGCILCTALGNPFFNALEDGDPFASFQTSENSLDYSANELLLPSDTSLLSSNLASPVAPLQFEGNFQDYLAEEIPPFDSFGTNFVSSNQINPMAPLQFEEIFQDYSAEESPPFDGFGTTFASPNPISPSHFPLDDNWMSAALNFPQDVASDCSFQTNGKKRKRNPAFCSTDDSIDDEVDDEEVIDDMTPEARMEFEAAVALARGRRDFPCDVKAYAVCCPHPGIPMGVWWGVDDCQHFLGTMFCLTSQFTPSFGHLYCCEEIGLQSNGKLWGFPCEALT